MARFSEIFELWEMKGTIGGEETALDKDTGIKEPISDFGLFLVLTREDGEEE
jgi:hypothetical protein